MIIVTRNRNTAKGGFVHFYAHTLEICGKWLNSFKAIGYFKGDIKRFH